jgi:hypothetical protein
MKVVLEGERPFAQIAYGEGDVDPTASGARNIREQPHRGRLGPGVGRARQRNSGDEHN